jgi:hypothetical protein
VVDHHNYHCADTRDHVFGLLYEPPNQHGTRRGPAIRPDYTKSTFQILLQLLEQEARERRHDENGNRRNMRMEDTLAIISKFHLGPLAAEMADILRLRRSTHAAPSPSSRRLVFDYETQQQILLRSDRCCSVWEDGAGNLVTSLLQDSPPSAQNCGHDLQYIDQHTKGSAVKIRNCLGRVVALADEKVKAGDKLLFFGDFTYGAVWPPEMAGLGPPVAGLITRLAKCGIRILVGQVVIDQGIGPYGPYGPLVSDRGNGTDSQGFDLKQEWFILMSPLDLILFAAQDMITEVSSSRDGAVIKRTYCPEQTAKRLTTSVTSDLNSSYVIRKPRPRFGGLPRGFLTVLDRSVMNFP